MNAVEKITETIIKILEFWEEKLRKRNKSQLTTNLL